MGSMAFVGNSTNALAPIAPYAESLSYVCEMMGIHEVRMIDSSYYGFGDSN